MAREPRTLTPDEIVNHVVSNARLEGNTLEQETIEVVRRIAHGKMSRDEIKARQRERVAEIQAKARSRNND